VSPTDGSCWVAAGESVMHLAAAGAILSQMRGFSSPGAVSVDSTDGSCWVADTGNDQVVHVSAAGAELWRGGTASLPLSVSADPTDGSCRVADYGGSQVVHLTVVSPIVVFSAAPTSGLVPLTVQFTDASSNDPEAWLWESGDGGTSTLRDPVHTYLAAGWYLVRLTASNVQGASTAARPHYILVNFPDVPLDFWALRQILACVEARVVTGYPDGNCAPSALVSRDQMAVYISRALFKGAAQVPTAPAVASFPDVPTNHRAFSYVEFAKAQGIVTGYPDPGYHPRDPVDRGQAAVFVARTIAGPTGEPPLAGYGPPVTPSFADVPSDFWAYKHIEYIEQAGATGGYPDGNYYPNAVVTRDQLAVYVQRAFRLY